MSRGFKIIGTTFITSADQVNGTQATEFRAAALNGGWRLWDTFQAWRNVVAAAAKSNDMKLLDISSRIATGLQFSEMRLYDLAMSYSAQLHGHLKDNEPKEREAFKDTFSPGVYKDIHGLFWEMAVLRDVLAQFVAVYCLGREDATTLSGLRRSLNKSPSRDVEANRFVALADKQSSGWMATFGSYRDCFTHSAPLHEIEGSSWAIQDLLILKDGKTVPQIYYPLPADTEELSRRRAKGPLFTSLDEMAKNASRKRERTSEPDALEYLHTCLCQFTELAAQLLNRSPLQPRPVVITEADVIGEIKVTPR
ncbi:hypothetical protein DYQ86_22255 [Acidobacteria bacterium AB60]|nr:hypothetical protein DYQ86_22255 [Acidobacteria bacterium AB60]